MFFNHQQCFFIIEQCFLDYTMFLSDYTMFFCELNNNFFDCTMFFHIVQYFYVIVKCFLLIVWYYFLSLHFFFLQQQFAPHLSWCQYDDISNDINSVTQISSHDHKSRIVMPNWWSQLHLWLKLTMKTATTGNVCNTVCCVISHCNLLSEQCFYKLNIVFSN